MMRLPFLLTLLLAPALAFSAAVEWDAETFVFIQPAAVYGRMIRLPGGDILCSYEQHGRSNVCRSTDNGRTWQQPRLAGAFAHGPAANPEMLRLRDGRILYFYNERAQTPGHDYSIVMTAIDDTGTTTTAPRRLFSTREGCWEPVAIELPSGEIQLYFANEALYPDTHEQDITLMRSHDGGETWSAPERIAFRPNHRDGMPVPLLLRDSKGIAVAIEDDGLHGLFKPAIVHTTLENNWRSGTVDGASPSRWSALASPLAADVYAGAPYLAQLPCGTTLLSCQSTEGGRTERAARMVVYTGNNEARNFADPTIPFDVPIDIGSKWNSLFVKDAHTVTAITSTIIDGKWGLYAIDGRVGCCETKQDQ